MIFVGMHTYIDYGDTIYHKHDPGLELYFTKKLESTQYSAALAVEQADRSFMTNLVGRISITGDGTIE